MKRNDLILLQVVIDTLRQACKVCMNIYFNKKLVLVFCRKLLFWTHSVFIFFRNTVSAEVQWHGELFMNI